MNIEKEHTGLAMNDERRLIEKRDSYRRELSCRINQHTHTDDFMIEVFQKLLEDVEQQLNNNE